ncbi:MAG: response regulator [Prevotella sp.]|nr:response regulator [Prevotella sp.]
MFMRILRTIVFFMVMTISSICYATSYYFRTIDVKDGLADYFVRDIVQDSRGYIWISTINGLSRYDGYRFHNYLPVQFGANGNDVFSVRETADNTLWMRCSGDLYTYSYKRGTWQKDGAERLSQMGVKGTFDVFYVDDKKNIWVSTECGVYNYDFSQKKLHHIANYSKSPLLHIISKNGTTVIVTTDYNIYEVSQKTMKLVPVGKASMLTYNRDSRVFLDNNMNLWLYQSHSQAGSQWVFSLKDHQWRRMDDLTQMGNVLVNTITVDHDGNLWVGTVNSGVHVFSVNPDDSSLTETCHLNVFAPQSSHISCLYLDDNNTMWVGSSKLGVAFTDLCAPTLNMVSTGEYEDVSSMLQDRHGNLWIGFDGDGVMKKSKDGSVTHYSATLQQLPSNIVTSLTLDADGNVLVGTYGNGMAKFDGSKFIPVYTNIPNIGYVKAMVTDTRGNLWVATVDKGVVKIRPDGKYFQYTTENSPLVSNGILCLAVDSLRNIIYIGTSTGVSAYDYEKDSFIRISQLEQLNGSYVLSLMMCDRNLLWIGSRNGLWVYRAKDSSMTRLTTEAGMSHNTIRALAESGGKVWASTDNGLTCITSAFTQGKKGDVISYKCHPFYDSNGLHDVLFSNNASLTTDDGTVLLGSFRGYASIPPEEMVAHYPQLNLEFTNFWINEKEDIQLPSQITLHYQDRLGIAVSAMVPSLSHQVKYYYRFKGDEKWIQAPGNILNFVSLRPGNHILQIKAQIPGVGEGDMLELAVKVLPSFWQSWPALMLYALLIAAIVYLIYRAIRNRQKRELAINQLEMNLRKFEMEEEKIRFFTNISHDIKTPLTLVLAPLEKIRNNPMPEEMRPEVDMAWRNSRQLYDLIQQLLDFSRLDEGMEKLNLKHGDIVSFVRQTAQGFSYFAIGKQIKLHLNLPQAPMEIAFDENKMRRIITNLLSNAFKYNIDKGSVTVSLEMKDKGEERQLFLQIADTGIGIHDKHHIFNRFTQETHGQEQEGSGLGLYIVKKYVDMMQGNIVVTDNSPQGTIFTVTMPVVATNETVGEGHKEPVDDMSADNTMSGKEGKQKPTILLVDDNSDTRLFLQRSLEDEYTVLLAANGKEALLMMEENEDVDIVISDVMMPEMDGIELFRKLKCNINFSHVPVILLTAKSSEENIVAGLQEGVADYITKPFSLRVLRLRIKMILEQAQRMHNQVANGIEIKPSEITVSSLDEELISHVIQNIEEHINDVNYSVAQLSAAVGMTRGHLYKKLMAITGKSPLEFIRIIKIKRGKSLLDQGITNISEVSDMVGFSPKQFTHYFKMMYDVTPSDYLRTLK